MGEFSQRRAAALIRQHQRTKTGQTKFAGGYQFGVSPERLGAKKGTPAYKLLMQHHSSAQRMEAQGAARELQEAYHTVTETPHPDSLGIEKGTQMYVDRLARWETALNTYREAQAVYNKEAGEAGIQVTTPPPQTTQTQRGTEGSADTLRAPSVDPSQFVLQSGFQPRRQESEQTQKTQFTGTVKPHEQTRMEKLRSWSEKYQQEASRARIEGRTDEAVIYSVRSTLTSVPYELVQTGRAIYRTVVHPVETGRAVKHMFINWEEIGQQIGTTAYSRPSTSAGFVITMLGEPLIYSKLSKGARNIYRRAGTEHIPPEKVFDVDVLEGKATFPTAPSPEVAVEEFQKTGSITDVAPHSKVVFKERGGRPLPQGYIVADPYVYAIETEVGAHQRGGLRGAHATTTSLPSQAEVKAGPMAERGLEDPGLYITPAGRGSPHFLGLSDDFSYYDMSFGLPKFDTPQVLEVKFKQIKRLPEALIQGRGFEEVGDFLRSRADTGEAYITKRSEIGMRGLTGKGPGTSELEAVIPETAQIVSKPKGTLFQRFKGYTKHTYYKGEVIPIREFETVGGKQRIRSAKQVSFQQLRDIDEETARYYSQKSVYEVKPAKYLSRARGESLSYSRSGESSSRVGSSRFSYDRGLSPRRMLYPRRSLYPPTYPVLRVVERPPYRSPPSRPPRRPPSYPPSYPPTRPPVRPPVYPPLTPPPKRPPPPILPRGKDSDGGGWNVLVKSKQRKTGRGSPKYASRGYAKANPKPLTRRAALGFGAQMTDESTARSFRIVPSEKKANPSLSKRFERQWGVRGSKFRTPVPGSKEPVGTLIERRLYAIDTRGELEGITWKGWVSKREKHNWKSPKPTSMVSNKQKDVRVRPSRPVKVRGLL